MRTRLFAVTLGVAVVLTAGSARAQSFLFPKKANKFQSTMVTGYAPCMAPTNDTSGVLALAACHPAAPNDTVCGFAFDTTKTPPKPLGQGKLQANVTGKGDTVDVKLQVKLQGLNAGCIGETLCITPFVRVSSLGCTSGDPGGCTIAEVGTNPFPLSGTGCGVVDEKGKVQINTTVDTFLGLNLIPGGTHFTLDIARTGVRRTTGPSLPAAGTLTFVAGLDAN